MSRNILVIGSAGQIGSELVPALRTKYGGENVVATDIKTSFPETIKSSGPAIYLDALDKESIAKVISEYKIDTIFHMASILSATGEKKPQKAWDINLNGLINVLEVARNSDIKNIIWPSSIAAFGPTTPRDKTPNITILRPTTMYGITKVAGELLAEYYYSKYQLDVRSMRLPGIISSETLPGGGTTDYAVEIFYGAIKNKRYTSFLKEDTVLPMLYMPDCIKCMLDLLEAENSKLSTRVYNLTGISFSVGEIAAEIKKHLPAFKIKYRPDFRQAIADSWPKTIDDSLAREDWGWNPSFNLVAMTKDMMDKLSKRL